MFDGSSIAGLEGHQRVGHDAAARCGTAVLDPFFEESTVNMRCDVLEPSTMQGYERDPRSLAKRAEAYPEVHRHRRHALFGPERILHLRQCRWQNDMGRVFYEIDSQGAWNSRSRNTTKATPAIVPGVKGGYFPVPPVDAFQDIRAPMCKVLEELGLKVEVHHHEVATGGQCEIGVAFGTLVKKADEVQILKYVIKNVAHGYGKTATFMPKPIVGDNGSGMHVHQSICRRTARRCSPATSTAACRRRAVLHRRHHQARQGDQRLHQLHHQQLQAPGARATKRR
jgi:glutamine synthetase